jgi:3-hydroxyisobutyrate dehydrogenase-like beta-hydroxyacid dehydrogenase
MPSQIGFLGLGKMGAGMAARLVETGHDVIVWNRTLAKCDALREFGAMVATVPGEVSAQTEIIISMLHDDYSAEEVLNGADGLLSVPVDGKLFIDMSTLRPEAAKAMAQSCNEHGAEFIDAPVSGTVGPARSGQLMALVGGSEANLERARPILEHMTRRIVHAGPVGSGSLLKLVLNLPLAVYWQSLAEAISMGHAGGLDIETMLNVINDSGGGLSALSHKVSMITEGSADVAFDVKTMIKDAHSILAKGDEYSIPMPTMSAALDSYNAAHAAGLGDADAVAIVRFLLDSQDSASPEE